MFCMTMSAMYRSLQITFLFCSVNVGSKYEDGNDVVREETCKIVYECLNFFYMEVI